MSFATMPMVATITAAGERWVAIYARISRDRSGRGDNVETQIRLATEYAKAKWPGVRIEVYCDNDMSAADPDTFRPQYHRLLGDIAAGHVAEIVSADHERLIRQIVEGEALIPLLRAAGIDGTWGYRDGFTSVRPGETTVTRIKHVMGAEYVEGLKVKLHEKQEANAGKGIPHGGVKYGYQRGVLPSGDKTLVVDDEQAGRLRWMAEQVLDHDRPLTQIAAELNASGVPTGFVWAKGTMKRERERRDAGLEPEERQPARWSSGNVRGVLTNLTIAGRRQYRGVDVGPGNWEPIVDTDTHEMLRAKLIRPRTGPQPARRKYLLSGLVFCGLCGARLTGQLRKRRSDKGASCAYRCKECFGINIAGDALEAHVSGRVLERLDRLVELRRTNAGTTRRRREINDELAALQQRRAQMGEMMADGVMDEIAYVRGKARLDDNQAAFTRELAALPKDDDDLPDPDMVRHAWDYLDTAEQRRILSRCIDRVEIAKRPNAARRFDLSRVTIHGLGWEDEPAPPPPGAVAAAWRTLPADLTDAEWELVAPLVAPVAVPRGRGNRSGQPLKYPLRTIVDAALHRETTGCFWRDLPDRYPPHRTVDRYHQHWVRSGVWDAVCARLQALANGEPIPAGPDREPRWRRVPSDVTDAEWELVADLVAPRRHDPGRGRPYKFDMRQILNAVLYREATGCAWRDLPDRYPPHRSVDHNWHQWLRDGTWHAVRQHLTTTPADGSDDSAT